MKAKTVFFICAAVVVCLMAVSVSIPEASTGMRLWHLFWMVWNGVVLRGMWDSMKAQSKSDADERCEAARKELQAEWRAAIERRKANNE